MSKLKKSLLTFAMALLLISSTFLLAACEDETQAETYNIIVTNATIPPMMALLDAIDNGNETYMWYGRPNTFASVDNLAEIVSIVKQESVNQTGINNEAVSIMQNKVNQLYQKNTNSKFRFYVTDYGVEVALRIMAQNRVPESNYKVLLLEDGTGSYTNFNSNYSADGAISTLNENIELINNKYTASWNRELAPYEDGTAGNITKWAQSVAYATRSNVEYWLQFPEMLSSNDSTIASMLDAESSSELKINFVKKNLTQIYSQISVEKQSIFKNILIDNNISNIMNFNNSKPTLMITGTSYTGEQMGVTSTSTVLTPSEGSSFTLADKGYNDMFEATFDYILEMYGDHFNLVLKPHPSWTPSLDATQTGPNWSTLDSSALINRVGYLEENHIRVLPGQTPAEAIMWAYPSLYLAGYNSSLYMNEQNGKTLFFIGINSFSQLSSPVNSLVENGSVYAGYSFDPINQVYGKQAPQLLNFQAVVDWLAAQV